MIRLPVSGIAIGLTAPGGADDLVLMEARLLDRTLALDLLARVSDGAVLAALTVHDFEAALLHLHALVFGGRIVAEARCGCGERVDAGFAIADYLGHRAPKRPRGVTAVDGEWFTLKDTAGTFRLPTIGDQIAVAQARDPAAALAALCLRGTPPLAKIERAMDAMAPALSGVIEGTCPACRRAIALAFDVPFFVLSELRVQAAQVCEHVHVLATHYHWSEENILALPNWRRQHYVDRIAAQRAA
jgi:hypothetical protein